MLKTILVVDDTKKIRDIVANFLSGEGFAVKLASDGVGALKLARSGGIDLIVLDVMMPKMSGYDVFRALKEDKRTDGIPVILLTARAVLEHTPDSFFYGLYAAISKPFSKWELLHAVRDILKLTASQSKEQEKRNKHDIPQANGQARRTESS